MVGPLLSAGGRALLVRFVHGESRLFFDVFPEQIQIDRALAIACEDEPLGILMPLATAWNGTIRLQLAEWHTRRKRSNGTVLKGKQLMAEEEGFEPPRPFRA